MIERDNNKIQGIEHLTNQGLTRKFYEEINRIMKDYKPRLTLCKGYT
jgi:hypothetical protein